MKRNLLFMAVLFITTIAGAQNLLTNGNFEAWADQAALPDEWNRGAGTIGTNYLFATDAQRGNVLRLTDQAAKPGSKRFSNNADISITEPGTYRASFFVKGTVKLRYLALSQGHGNPGNTASATSHNTVPVYDVESPEWKEIVTDIVIPEDADFSQPYNFHIVWSATTEGNNSDFLLDDVLLTKVNSTGVDDISYPVEVRGVNGKIQFTDAASGDYKIYSLSGSELKSGKVQKGLTIDMQHGVYLVKTNLRTYKVIL